MRTEPFGDAELSRNKFLGGLAHLWQPLDGYRAGIDPVMLAAAVEARPGQEVLDLGCGGGAAMICLAARVGGLGLTGVELQPGYADLARRNLAENHMTGEVWCADVAELPAVLRERSFHHVLCNPPYFRQDERSPAQKREREIALAGGADGLDQWVRTAARRLHPGGTATFICRAERLPELLYAYHLYLGAIEVLPLQPRAGKPAKLVIVRGRKARRGAFKLHAPVLMHRGARHEGDAESYTEQVLAVQRDGAPLVFPG